MNLPADYRPSFLDIGCGNGLLVFLLNSEGYPGKGIDIRARKLWSLYPPQVQLQVLTLVPTATTSFAQYDWLLGNHSDELTPWLPMMALNSSIERTAHCIPTRFWVLPCCPFSFFGKFQREKFQISSSKANNSNNSRYGDYLNYVESVGRTCGFQVEVDRLRIPSTRRICLIGKCGVRSAQQWETVRQSAGQLLIASQATSFKPRAAVEAVKNCTRVDRTFLDKIVDLTAGYLLESAPVPASREVEERGEWNAGGSILLADLAAKILHQLQDLRLLKTECGGLQTVLRNHSHVFVVERQRVRLRSPKELSASEWRTQNKRKPATTNKTNEPMKKNKICWFFRKHPDGCPLSAESCRYLHE